MAKPKAKDTYQLPTNKDFPYPPSHPFSACVPGRYVPRIDWRDFLKAHTKSTKAQTLVALAVDPMSEQTGSLSHKQFLANNAVLAPKIVQPRLGRKRNV